MTNILILSRRNAECEWEYISKNISVANKITIISSFDCDSHINYMKYFYRYIKLADINSIALKIFGEQACTEIILRCRLLRNIKKELAIRMIGAMFLSLSEIVENEKSNIVISSLVDFFVPDILQRIIEERNGKFVGIARSILSGRVLISARGEFNPINNTNEEEINIALEQLLSPTFAPTVKSNRNYNFLLFMRKKLRWETRWLWFDVLRYLNKDHLNPELLITRKPGDDYYMTFQDWYKIEKSINKNWDYFLQNSCFEKRVFIGLQYYPECTIDYWVNDLDLANWILSLSQVVKVLSSAGYTIFVKDHPVSYGLRRSEFLSAIKGYPNVVLVPYEVTSQILIRSCQTIFTWTGTIGIQSAISGRCPIITNSYYSNTNDFIVLKKMEDINKLPTKINDFSVKDDLKSVQKRIAQKICECSVKGNIMLSGFSLKNNFHRHNAKTLADSLETSILLK